MVDMNLRAILEDGLNDLGAEVEDECAFSSDPPDDEDVLHTFLINGHLLPDGPPVLQQLALELLEENQLLLALGLEFVVCQRQQLLVAAMFVHH